VDVDGREIGVFRLGNSFYAYANRCPHQGGPACRGRVTGRVEAVLAEDRTILEERFSREQFHLACPWHGWEFDLATGVSPTAPEYRLERFDVIQRGEDIYVVT
jgi:nitrite reductase/ring-hydroxylating ferredoxin subunit